MSGVIDVKPQLLADIFPSSIPVSDAYVDIDSMMDSLFLSTLMTTHGMGM